ncbi:DUF4097 family beta strand repeat-containing protein [Kitasatospora sp. NBC_01266]|uniref:DUF4097 family beta strand repeat-containing protein n=1 Tax=Kitasatospora sp. NBC_01266 TaxID=2903572 RepID=UPI002E30B8DA|nr:DUF4097 family beta strand repeat-containing protein [Kitasatospora sp. NBC_01266]
MSAAEQLAASGTGRGSERRIWRGVGTLAGAVVILISAGQTWTSLVRQSSVHPTLYSSRITALELDLQDANATISPALDNRLAVQQSEHWTVGKPVVTPKVEGHTLRISTRCPQVLGITEPSCSVGLDIAAPPGTAVTIKSTSGDTRIRGLTGALSLRSYSGSIELDDVSGRIAAQLTSGSLTGQHLTSTQVQAAVTSGAVDLQFAAPPHAVALACTSGSLHAGLPPGSTYRLNVSGSSDVDPALTDPNSPNTISAFCGSGNTSLGFAPG